MKNTKILTETSVSIALAVICSFIKIWEMPQGGSIALTMVPILFISFRRGALSGMIAGAIYGIISLMIAGIIYHPMSILLDYLLAFAVLGVAGLFPKSTAGIWAGCTAGVFGRFICSLISGAVLFASYAPEGQNPWIYSLVYQASYMVPEFIICIAVMLLINFKAKRLLSE